MGNNLLSVASAPRSGSNGNQDARDFESYDDLRTESEDYADSAHGYVGS